MTSVKATTWCNARVRRRRGAGKGDFNEDGTVTIRGSMPVAIVK